MRRVLLLSSAAAFAMLAPTLAATPTLAQRVVAGDDPNRGRSVTERSRPDFDAAGLRVGSFLIYPSLAVSGVYDSNIFATSSNEESDFAYVLEPTLEVESDWGIHALGLRAGARFGRFTDFDSEDFDNYFAFAQGRLDLPQGTVFGGSAGYERLQEDRTSPSAPDTEDPVEFDLITARLQLAREVARLGARLNVAMRDLDFDDVGSGAALVEQDNRDRTEYTVGGRVSYETSPNLAGFVQASYNWRSYDLDTGRDSDGYRVEGGIALDFGGVTTGDLFVGYRSRDYDNPAFDDISGFTFGAEVEWNPTPLTSVGLLVTNIVEETATAGSPGYVETRLAATVDHELLRNLILSAEASYATQDYEEIDREDDVYAAGVGAEYLINRYVSVEAAYTYSSRNSDLALEEFDRHTVVLRLIGKI